ncbi:MAG TPA: histidine--tRNA ligase [Bryobacteraceae bacterium]|jgi:histidyl-tRNA synthetase|nr:histidine--tRNA ligase [Bryobacteraceae bacterium]
MQLEPPRGMRDFYPEDLELRDRIFAAWTAASTLHGFQRFEPPVVESFELLARKAGEEVAQQIYHFEDKSNRQLALRPEVTPSLVRMISARPQDIVFPAKWWTIGQCFRYERMTRGRKREHFQWNLDIVGEPSVQAEAWILAGVTSALAALGLGPQDVRIHINNRQVVAYLLCELGVPLDQHVDVFMVLDKKGKVPVETLQEMLVEKGLAVQTADAVIGQLGSEAADSLTEGPLAASPAAEEVRRLLDLADAMGFGEYLRFDSGVVRGLSYYTGAVFEGFDTARRFRAIFGGGRYDNLFADMTGVARPAVGMGFGDVVIAEILTELRGFSPAKPKVEVCVGMFDAALSRDAARVAAELVAAGIQTDLAFSAGKPGKFFGYADRRGARFTVFLAPNELRDGAAAVKEMASGEQRTVRLAELAGWLRQRLRA